MKAKERHDLHTNVLADWIGETTVQLKPYSGLIVAGLAVVAIALAAFSYMRGASERGSIAASDQLITAMDMQNEGLAELQATIKQYPGTTPAYLAQLLLAETFLDSGATTLYRNKPAARENISKALAAFDDVEKKTRDSMLRSWALYGMARAEESLGDLSQARLAYQQLLTDFPESAVAGPAKEHLNRLDQPAVKEFYEWFATQNPKPPAAETGSGVPGLKPSFDVKDEPSAGDVKLPSALGSGPAAGSSPATGTTPAATPSTSTPGGTSGAKSSEKSK